MHELATDPATGQIILYGGCSSGFGPCPQGDLWSYDPAAGTWTNITPVAGPAARSNPAMVWDTAAGRALLFGGLSEAGQTVDLWDGRFVDGVFTWSELSQGGELPAARASHDAVYLDGSMYVFGGSNSNGVLNDLWRLNL